MNLVPAVEFCLLFCFLRWSRVADGALVMGFPWAGKRPEDATRWGRLKESNNCPARPLQEQKARDK